MRTSGFTLPRLSRRSASGIAPSASQADFQRATAQQYAPNAAVSNVDNNPQRWSSPATARHSAHACSGNQLGGSGIVSGIVGSIVGFARLGRASPLSNLKCGGIGVGPRLPMMEAPFAPKLHRPLSGRNRFLAGETPRKAHKNSADAST